MNDPRYLHTEEKQEGETFFDVMNRLIARNKAVTADMEAVLAELESEIEPFLIRRSGRDIFAPLDLIAFSLQATKQFF